MGKDTRIIKIRESILQENRAEAAEIRKRLDATGVRMVNVMASPGAGKTSLILASARLLAQCAPPAGESSLRLAVIEADIDSTVDSDRIIAAGIPAVQIETGGFCHVDATMTGAALDALSEELASRARTEGPARQDRGLDLVDVVFLENVGNLICTAQHDTGAHVNLAILSVPEGDDKPLKYPVMFQAADVIVINKTDYLEIADFSLDWAIERIAVLNRSAPVFAVSCRTGAGMQDWVDWLCRRLGAGGA